MEDNIKNTSAARSAAVVFLVSGVRWVLACARIVFVAYLFGATFAYDAYLIAFAIPEMITGLLVGILAVTFIPIFTEHLTKESEIKAWDFASNLINIIFIMGLLLTIVMISIAPFIIRVVAPGFNQDTFQLAVRLVIIIFPIILIMSLSELAAQMLHIYQRFAVSALSRILEILVLIIYLIFLSQKQGIFSLAYGLLLGAIFRFVFLLPFLWRKFKYYRFTLNFKLPGVRKVIFFSGPLISCMLFLRVGILIERMLASTLKEGTISILGYATSFTEVPVEVFINSLGIVLLPLISKYAAEKNIVDFKAMLSRSIRMGNFVLFPIAILFIAFGKQIIKSLLERGLFTSSMTQDTSLALAVYSLGLMSMAFYFFSVQACYALQEVKAAVKIAVFVTIVNIALKLTLINYLAFFGLALATSIALIIQSGLLFRLIKRKMGSLDEKYIFFSSLKMLAASILMAGTCGLVLKLLPSDSNQLILLAVLIITAGISYIIYSYLMRSQELAGIKDLLKNMICPIRIHKKIDPA